MLEDSISSSPSKSNRSIHKARIQRKIRRRHCVSQISQNQSEANEFQVNTETPSRIVSLNQVATLADLYWEDWEGEPNARNGSMNKTFGVHPQKYGEDFDPFEDELLLAVADRLDCEQARSQCKLQRMQTLQIGQGFVKCSQLPLDVDDVKTGPKTQFGVTESELLNFCAEAEEKLDTFDMTPPPKRHKSIVESILEDFCSSPLSLNGDVPEQQCSSRNTSKNTPGQLLHEIDMEITPVFSFKNKPLRTYSGRRSRTNACISIAHRFETVASTTSAANANDSAANAGDDHEDEFDVLSNSSSGLSIQEDLTQRSESPKTLVEINKSGRVCENLLNLSAFFTQQPISEDTQTNTSAEIYQTEQEEISHRVKEKEHTIGSSIESFDPCATVAKLIAQITVLRKDFQCLFSRSRVLDDGDFYGFPETLVDVDSTLHYNDVHDNTTIQCPNFFKHNSDEDDDDNNLSATIFEDDICSEGSSPARTATDCGLNCVSQNLKHSYRREEELFSDSEGSEWQDDCDFFKHFKTQDVLSLRTLAIEATDNSSILPQKFNGFMSASNKPIAISAAAKQRAAHILAEVDDNLNCAFKSIKEERSCNPIQIQVEEKKQQTMDIIHRENLPGFETASKKQIKVSDEAKKRAEAVLANLPVIPVKNKEKLQAQIDNATYNSEQDDVGFDNIQLSEWLITDDDDGGGKNRVNLHEIQSTFQGFQTASKKQIKISEEAKRQALKILSDLPDLPKSSSHENSKTKENLGTPIPSKELPKREQACAGFCTASNKSIGISEEAKKKAASILKTLPYIQLKTRTLIKDGEQALDPLSNIPKEQSSQCNQQNFEFDNTLKEEASTPVQKGKLFNKSSSNTDSLRTPLASHFDNNSIITSSPASQNLCLTSLVKSALISRKNLLSLGKRKKFKCNKDKNRIDPEISATPTASYIERISTTSLTPNVQEFFAAVPNTSTPRPNRVRSEVTIGANDIEVDFKKIEWNQSQNNSRTPTTPKLDNSCENITVISSNPSPKMRIARLHMYGKPPPVSPILMASTNNCRPSGLRRGRSMREPR